MFTQLLYTGGICTVGWFMICRGVPGPSSLLPLAWPSSTLSMNSMFNLYHSSLSHLPSLGPLGAASTPSVLSKASPGAAPCTLCFLVALEQACSPEEEPGVRMAGLSQGTSLATQS